MDRPLPSKLKQVEYVQPQYIVDSLNNLHLLPTAPYKPGIPPPAHLSPFVDGVKEGYQPKREQEIALLKGEQIIEEESSSDEQEDENEVNEKPEEKQDMKDDVDSSDSDEEEDLEKEKEAIQQTKLEK